MKKLLQSFMEELRVFMGELKAPIDYIGLKLLKTLSLVPKSQLQKKEEELQNYRKDMDKFRDQVIDAYHPVMIIIPKEQGRDMAELKLQAGLKLLEKISDQNLIHYLVTDKRVVAQMDLLLWANNLFEAKLTKLGVYSDHEK